MAKPRASGTPRKTGREGKAELPDIQTHEVGTRLRARLWDLGTRIGLYPLPAGFSVESRFRQPSLLGGTEPVPAGMRAVFEEELASRERLGEPMEYAYRADFAPYRVYCVAHYHYDGFRALFYVEQDGAFLAGWKDEEVEPTQSPRTIQAGQDFASLEAFLDVALHRKPTAD